MEVFKVFPKDRVPQRPAGERTIVPARGGLHGFSPGQVSTPFTSAKRLSERTAEHFVDIPGGGLHAVQGFLPGSSSTADIPPGGGMGDSRGRVKRRAVFLPVPSSSTSAEQNVDSPAPVVRSRRARRTV